MASIMVELRGIPETEASIGAAGGHSVVVDRPDGVAGSGGLGFNGGQLLALAIGDCLCNDLRCVAHETGVRLASASVDVTVEFEDSPLLATSADLRVSVRVEDAAADVAALVQKAVATFTVSNSISRDLPVRASHEDRAGASIERPPAPGRAG